MEIQHVGSLITYQDEAGRDVCLGYLMDFGRGVYSPDGKVEVSKADADTHNRLLDEAMLKGLDDRCEIGQRGTFYFGHGKDGRTRVTTWLGTVVSERVRTSGVARKTVFFRRGGKEYRGTLQKDADCFNFKRIK